MNTQIPVVILSAELATHSVEANTVRTADLKQTLDDMKLKWREARGTYNGREEVSIVIPLSWDKLYLADSLRYEYGQESYLLIDSNSLASLEFRSGKSQILGKFTELNGKPLDTEDYTEIGGTYYAIR